MQYYNKCYHVKCFTCQWCNKPIVEHGYYDHNGVPVCVACEQFDLAIEKFGKHVLTPLMKAKTLLFTL